MTENKLDRLLEDLKDKKYWDIHYLSGQVGRVGRVQTRMEYSKEQCETIISEIQQVIEKAEKLESKLKMMEISFEQINNSRNDLIRQLAEQEKVNESLQQQIKQLQEENKELWDKASNWDLAINTPIQTTIRENQQLKEKLEKVKCTTNQVYPDGDKKQ